MFTQHTKHRYAWVAALLFAATLAGCSLIASTAYSPGHPSDADVRAANTLGSDFTRYVRRDPNATPADKAVAANAVASWSTYGATTETVALVAPVYQRYVANDPTLTDREKNLRMMSLEGWTALVGSHYNTDTPGFWGLTAPKVQPAPVYVPPSAITYIPAPAKGK